MDCGKGRCCCRTVRVLAFLLLVSVFLIVTTCRYAGLPLEHESVSEFVSSRDGGDINHPAGATLSIPPGALSRDTTIVITDEGVSPIDPYTPMVPVSRRFSLDLGGAAVLKDLTLDLSYSDSRLPSGAIALENLVVVAQVSEGVHRISPAKSESGTGMYASARLRHNRELVSDAAQNFELQHIMPSDSQLIFALLQAPFYSQDGLNWCVPTSIAMLYNYHVWNPDVRASNWHVAGLAKTPRGTQGAPPDGVLDKSGAKGLYAGYYWDADLIPSAPLTHFLQSITHGWDIVELFGSGQYAAVNKVDPRPVMTSSSTGTGLHGYLIVGASFTGLRIHDSSGALTGIHGVAGYMSWEQYRDTIAKDGDMDAWTAHLSLPVRPEEQRRGSIVLLGGKTRTITYEPFPDNADLHYDWEWDGADPYSAGYRWIRRDDRAATDDEEFGHAFDLIEQNSEVWQLAGVMRCRPRIANLTTADRTYRIVTYVANGTTAVILDMVATDSVIVPAQSWQGSVVEHELDMTLISRPGLYRMGFLLYEGNVLQDTKTVVFRVAEQE